MLFRSNQMKLEKRFGQSPVFVASTLLENGGLPSNVSHVSLLKEAIQVISCGYEDKTEWGKEVCMKSKLENVHFLNKPTFKFLKLFSASSGWLDIWFCHGGYLDWI